MLIVLYFIILDFVEEPAPKLSVKERMARYSA